jgi:hypothetical protein
MIPLLATSRIYATRSCRTLQNAVGRVPLRPSRRPACLEHSTRDHRRSNKSGLPWAATPGTVREPIHVKLALPDRAAAPGGTPRAPPSARTTVARAGPEHLPYLLGDPLCAGSWAWRARRRRAR